MKDKDIILDFSSMSNAMLLDLISKATSELIVRSNALAFSINDTQSEVVFKPSKAEESFIKKCLAKSYVHAQQKDEYRQLSKKYEDWFVSERLPKDLRGSDKGTWEEYYKIDGE